MRSCLIETVLDRRLVRLLQVAAKRQWLPEQQQKLLKQAVKKKHAARGKA